MTKPPATSGSVPACRSDVCEIEIRGPGGDGLIRLATRLAAEEIVRKNLGEWRRASNGRYYVALLDSRTYGKAQSRRGLTDGTVVRDRIRRNGQAISAPHIYRHVDSEY